MKQTKTLNDLAKVYKTKALQAINPGVKYSYKTGVSKAYKSGNLYDKVASSNDSSKMFIYDKESDRYILTLNIAPSGAEYGKYVHDGTYKMGKRPFAEIAAESPEVKQQVDTFIKEGVISDKMLQFFNGLDKKAKEAGLQVS